MVEMLEDERIFDQLVGMVSKDTKGFGGYGGMKVLAAIKKRDKKIELAYDTVKRIDDVVRHFEIHPVILSQAVRWAMINIGSASGVRLQDLRIVGCDFVDLWDNIDIGKLLAYVCMLKSAVVKDEIILKLVEDNVNAERWLEWMHNPLNERNYRG